MTEWKRTDSDVDVFNALDSGLKAQALYLNDWYDITLGSTGNFLEWANDCTLVRTIRYRQYRIEVKPPEPEYVDVVPKRICGDWMVMRAVSTTRSLTDASGDELFICYVWENRECVEFGSNDCVMYRDKDGNLNTVWAPDRTKEICKAVRFAKC